MLMNGILCCVEISCYIYSILKVLIFHSIQLMLADFRIRYWYCWTCVIWWHGRNMVEVMQIGYFPVGVVQSRIVCGSAHKSLSAAVLIDNLCELVT